MQLRRRRSAVAVALAVIAGSFGAAPSAHAEPPRPGSVENAGPADGTESDAGLPAVRPRPQSLRATASGTPARIGERVALVAGPGADAAAVRALSALLRAAGARTVVRVGRDEPLPRGAGLVVRAGRDPGTEHPDAAGARLARALRELGAPARGDLPAGGYRLAVGRLEGRDTVALAGSGGDGLFHAVQTLRQLVDGAAVAPVVVRDWPTAPVRGLTEGFYGTPWTHAQRLAQLDFMGRTKQNRYLYAPGDDLYRQARWREPYPAGARADFRALAARAARNHVTLAWAVSPGQAMCLSSDDDVRALNRKLDAMWALGIRAFQVQFQDVSYSEWHCGQDAEVFGSGPAAAARAQARVANAVARHLAGRHPGAAALSLLPTEYYQDGATAYRSALGRALGRTVQVAWTGVGVVPRTITGRDVAGAREAFGHPLVTMDNYPVNDYADDRVFLGPATGREPAVAAGSAAVLSTAMQQPAASRIALFTAADFAWNPRGYRPEQSWDAAIDDLAGGDAGARRAVRALAANDASSVLGAPESATLRPLVAAYWRAAAEAGTPGAGRAAARRLRDAFGELGDAPARLAGTELGTETAPWVAQLARYGRAGRAAVDMLSALADGDRAAAWSAARSLERLRDEIAAAPVTVGKGVLAPFLDRARAAFDAWAGLGHEPRARESADGRTVVFARPRRLLTATVLTEPGTRGALEVRVPGHGWHRLAPLSPTGWTEPAPGRGGVTADAVRVVDTGAEGPGGRGGSPADGGADASGGRVRHLVPWYADTPAARFALDHDETDAEIGGPPRRVTAELAADRPGTVAGAVTAQAPKGITVRVPKRSRMPRGTRAEVPLDVRVAAGTAPGTYEIPLTFGGRTRTLAVRAFPRTAGPDLARGAAADSSGDETPDFPARAASDGDPSTRWSSPAADGQWWRTRLPRPVRLGRVALHWQDAFASAYRVQVSADGRAWHTAATVGSGRGGQETVGLDAPRPARYLRILVDTRATRYGVSLWSVKVYAVAE